MTNNIKQTEVIQKLFKNMLKRQVMKRRRYWEMKQKVSPLSYVDDNILDTLSSMNEQEFISFLDTQKQVLYSELSQLMLRFFVQEKAKRIQSAKSKCLRAERRKRDKANRKKKKRDEEKAMREAKIIIDKLPLKEARILKKLSSRLNNLGKT